MTEDRYHREFGQGTLIGNDRHIFDQMLEKQVLRLGWSHACVAVDQVTKEFGVIWTRNRYAECNFVFGLVVEQAKNLNPDLYTQLTNPTPRLLPQEPAGIFDSRFTPQSHKKEMSPLSTLWGYALPRILIEQMGRGMNNKDRTNPRVFKALDILDNKIITSNDPIELVVEIAEAVCYENAKPEEVLCHLLPSGVLNEENCKMMLKDTINVMKKYAPVLIYLYNGLSDKEKGELGIAVL
ncbi:hypothetical protein BH10PAT1_BH10PAT1_4880 [soil metagenome]